MLQEYPSETLSSSNFFDNMAGWSITSSDQEYPRFPDPFPIDISGF